MSEKTETSAYLCAIFIFWGSYFVAIYRDDQQSNMISHVGAAPHHKKFA